MRFLVLLLLASTLFSCKKNDSEMNSRFDEWGQESKITVVEVNAKDAVLHIEGDSSGAMPEGFQRKLIYTVKSGALFGVTKEIVFTGSDIVLTGLDLDVTYDLELRLTYRSRIFIADKKSIRTNYFELDYDQFYSKKDDANYQYVYNDSNLIFSINGGSHLIYGENVSTAISAKFIAKDDPSQIISVPLLQYNGTTVELRPSNVTPDTPYAQFRYYYLKLDDEVFKSYHGWKNKVDDTAYFKIFNSAPGIDTIEYTPSPGGDCGLLTLTGHFGNPNLNGMPNRMVGVYVAVWENRVIFEKDGKRVQTISVSETDPGTCESATQFSTMKFTDEGIYYFHNTERISVRTALPPGSYKVYVESAFDFRETRISRSYRVTF